MEKIKDFDVREFAPESSATVTIAVGDNVRPSKRGVLSEQSELTERDEDTGRTAHNPPSEVIEETTLAQTSKQTRHVESNVPTSRSEQSAKPRQTVSTSPNKQSALSHQTASAQTTEPPQFTPAQPSRVSSRQRRASLDEYKETFLTIPRITDRQPVFVSRDMRDKIDSIVRRLGERKMSVSGFLENLARHHLDLYADDLEQWKRL